jgi:hypothetical protein
MFNDVKDTSRYFKILDGLKRLFHSNVLIGDAGSNNQLGSLCLGNVTFRNIDNPIYQLIKDEVTYAHYS